MLSPCVNTYANLYPSIPMLSDSYRVICTACGSDPCGAAMEAATNRARTATCRTQDIYIRSFLFHYILKLLTTFILQVSFGIILFVSLKKEKMKRCTNDSRCEGLLNEV